MERYTPGIKRTVPNRTYVHINMDTFVDDANGVLTKDTWIDFHPEEGDAIQNNSNIYEQTQANIQFYSQVLFSTGGKLALHKCYAYLLRTIWKNDKRRFVNTHNTVLPFDIT